MPTSNVIPYFWLNCSVASMLSPREIAKTLKEGALSSTSRCISANWFWQSGHSVEKKINITTCPCSDDNLTLSPLNRSTVKSGAISPTFTSVVSSCEYDLSLIHPDVPAVAMRQAIKSKMTLRNGVYRVVMGISEINRFSKVLIIPLNAKYIF